MQPWVDLLQASGEPDPSAKLAILAMSPLAPVEGAGRETILELGRLEQLARRQSVVEQGELARSLVLLGSGRVKMERRRGSWVFPLGHRGPGEMVGETAVVGGTATESATVLDPAVGLVLPMAGFRRLFATDASVRDAVLAAAVEGHRIARDRLAALLLGGVEGRLADFLLRASVRWGRQHPAGQVIAAPFTHAEIAGLIGSTRETVTLLLGKLRREGLVELDRRRIVIRDRPALERCAVEAGAAPDLAREAG